MSLPGDYYGTLNEVEGLVGLAFAAVSLCVAWLVLHRHPERWVLWLAVAFKLCCAVLYVLVIIFVFDSASDSVGYHWVATDIGEVIAQDFQHGSVSYLLAHPFFWFEPLAADQPLPVRLNVFSDNSSSDRLVTLSALLHLALGNTFLATTMAVALLGGIGQLLAYLAFRRWCPDPALVPWWRMGLLFFPSLTFWSAGLLKDPLGILGLGWALYGVSLFGREAGRAAQTRGLLHLLAGAFTLALFRLQVVPLLLCALAPWALVPPDQGTSGTRRSAASGRSLWIIRGAFAAAGVVLLVVLPQLDHRFDLAELPRTLSHEADLYNQGPLAPPSNPGASWSGMLAAWPGALVTALYRPFIWEGGGPVAAAAAAENMVLIALTARAIWHVTRMPRLRRALLRSRIFLMCATFVLLFSLALGASTPNLGTLSRYRLPLIPFFVGALAVTEAHYRRLAPAPAVQETSEGGAAQDQTSAPAVI